MALTSFAHYSIRTRDLESSLAFYTQVLGLREGSRPPLDFPGHWLYFGEDEATYGVLHLVGYSEDVKHGLSPFAQRRPLPVEKGQAALDHIAFFAKDRPSFVQRLEQSGLEFSERTVPKVGLHQVFVEDPDGIGIELNFAADD